MPDDIGPGTPPSIPASPVAPVAAYLSVDRGRSIQVADPDAVASQVVSDIHAAQDERMDWMKARILRYAKLYGWIEDRLDAPWEDASNQWVPIMIGNSLRMKAGLYNAVMGVRPIMDGKPTRKDHKESAERAAQLIDHQIITEARGTLTIERMIEQFVDDGTVITYVPWVRDKRKVVDVHFMPKRPEQDLLEVVPQAVEALYPDMRELVNTNDRGSRWVGLMDPPTPIDEDRTFTFEAWDRGKSVELRVTYVASVFDGPVPITQNLEDFVVPMRSENCQPVTPFNPGGAPWVARLIRIPRDEVLRRVRDGSWDLMSEEDAEALSGEPRVPQSDVNAATEDQLKVLRDEQVGLQTGFQSEVKKEDEWLTLAECYRAMDVDDDGLKEEVVFSLLLEDKKLVRARYLTEQYPVPPGQPPYRPFGEARYIPVPGQFYGLGLPELMEGVHDWIHAMINQAIDNGTLGSMPFGFYRASSGLKPEVYRPRPFELFPVDNPQQDVFFPNIPHGDQSFFLNMTNLAIQLMDRETQIGPVQLGQIPQGKASALRTVGTTMTLLQQGAAMPEQVLRRLLTGLSDVWSLVHRLNGRYLPPMKSYLIAGKPLEQDDTYGLIKDRLEINVPVEFTFQATLLNTNKASQSQNLMALGGALINPLTLQLGLVTPEQIYNWGRDLIQASQLDPSRYWKKPPGVPEGPRHTAEEALMMLFEGRMPEVAPLEPVMDHLTKLQEFMQSDMFSLFPPQYLALFQDYLAKVAQLAQVEAQQAALMQAADQFSQGLQQQGQGGQGGALPPLPPMQAESATASEIAGAGSQGPPGSAGA